MLTVWTMGHGWDFSGDFSKFWISMLILPLIKVASLFLISMLWDYSIFLDVFSCFSRRIMINWRQLQERHKCRAVIILALILSSLSAPPITIIS